MHASLDTIESEGFFLATAIASGPGTVVEVLARSPAVRQLASLPPDADAVDDPARAKIPLIAYAILFRLRMDRGAVPVLARYLDTLPPDLGGASLTLYHPYQYVLEALSAISRGGIRVDDPSGPGAPHAIAARARKWHQEDR
jgi:hypothetical protein